MDLATFLTIGFSAIFVNNFVLARFLGLCPFIGVTQKVKNALGMGAAVTFVMFMASSVTFTLYSLILVEGGAWVEQDLVLVLKTPMFILVIATLVQLVEMFLRSRIPALYEALGVYLPLITTNCAIMGVALINTTDTPEYMQASVDAGFAPGLLAASWHGIAAGLGFTVAMLLMSGIRERLDSADVPEPLRGTPIAFVCTGLMAMAFLGFSGMLGSG
ncbi:MAG: electron transport complex protein RnfA [Candidatus Brocadiia bacterium]|nr:electron transport complex subunit RsxA [Planctomycetota bacterium]